MARIFAKKWQAWSIDSQRGSSPSMIAVLFFGRMADWAGKRRLDVTPAPGGDSLFALRDRIFGDAVCAGQVKTNDVRMSLNRVVQVTDQPVADGDEVAFFSVFSGG